MLVLIELRDGILENCCIGENEKIVKEFEKRILEKEKYSLELETKKKEHIERYSEDGYYENGNFEIMISEPDNI